MEHPFASWARIGLAVPGVHRMMRLAEKVRDESRPGRDGLTDHTGIWIFGGPGVGKSHHAFTTYPDAYYKEPNQKWWPHYRGEEVVIIDEFTGAIPLATVLRWADKFPCRMETKGSMLVLNSHTTVILSNHPPWTMYTGCSPMRRAALYRRFKVYRMTLVNGVRSMRQVVPVVPVIHTDVVDGNDWVDAPLDPVVLVPDTPVDAPFQSTAFQNGNPYTGFRPIVVLDDTDSDVEEVSPSCLMQLSRPPTPRRGVKRKRLFSRRAPKLLKGRSVSPIDEESEDDVQPMVKAAFKIRDMLKEPKNTSCLRRRKIWDDDK